MVVHFFGQAEENKQRIEQLEKIEKQRQQEVKENALRAQIVREMKEKYHD